MKKINLLDAILLAIISASFLIRLYKLDSPIADWHSFRQADTSAVTRNFIKDGVDLLHPHADDMSNIQSGKDNPHRYRMVEFPIYNLLHYTTFQISNVTCSMLPVPCLSFESSGRLTTVLLSILSLLFLYGIVSSLSGSLTGLIAGAFFGLIPYNIYYSRVILPDPLMVTASLGAIWFFIKFINSNQNHLTTYYLLLISIIFSAISLLIKPIAIFNLLPLLYLIIQKWKLSSLKQPALYLYAILTVTPLILWRLWISQFPEGIPVYAWLLNSDGLGFPPAWNRGLAYERLTKLILGGFGLVYFVLGLVTKSKKTDWFYIIWLVSICLYLTLIATGNVRHDYYQIITIPIICIFCAKGLLAMWQNPNFNKFLSISISSILIPLFLFFSWYEVRGYYQINNPVIIEAGQAANQILPPEARVIAPYNGDTAFLYQINRPGWPLLTYYPIQKMIDLGATHYVSVNYDADTKELMQQFLILKQTDKYIILDLKQPHPL